MFILLNVNIKLITIGLYCWHIQIINYKNGEWTLLEGNKSKAYEASPAHMLDSTGAIKEGLHPQSSIINTKMHELFKIFMR
jgi:hypothetical protein